MEFLSRHKKTVIIFMTIVCLITMVVTTYLEDRPMFMEGLLSYIVTPTQRAVMVSSSWISDKINFLKDMDQIEKDNIALNRETEMLREQLTRMRLIEAESERLRELIDLAEKYPNYDMVGALVIGKDPSNWYMKFSIDKGSNHGLERNMVVLTTGGLVGRILEVLPTQSMVLALIDDASNVSAMSMRTDDLGFVRGDVTLMRDGLLRMDKIDIEAEIMENDEIITSHLGDIFPPGITIGRVVEVRLDPNGLTKYAIIQPAVDFKHIDTVLVINQTFGRESEFEDDWW